MHLSCTLMYDTEPVDVQMLDVYIYIILCLYSIYNTMPYVHLYIYCLTCTFDVAGAPGNFLERPKVDSRGKGYAPAIQTVPFRDPSCMGFSALFIYNTDPQAGWGGPQG